MTRPIWPIRVDVPWDPISGDVRCELVPAWDGGPCSSVHAIRRYQWSQELWYHEGCGWDWGSVSPEAQNYALAILDHFIPWAGDRLGRRAGRWVPCAQLAILLTPQFTADHVAGLSYWGGTIRGATIREWIAAEAPRWTEEGIDLAAESLTTDRPGRRTDDE